MPALRYISVLSDLVSIDVYMEVYMKYPSALSGCFTGCFSFQDQNSYLFHLNCCSLYNTRGDSLVLLLFAEGFCSFQIKWSVCKSLV